MSKFIKGTRNTIKNGLYKIKIRTVLEKTIINGRSACYCHGYEIVGEYKGIFFKSPEEALELYTFIQSQKKPSNPYWTALKLSWLAPKHFKFFVPYVDYHSDANLYGNKK